MQYTIEIFQEPKYVQVVAEGISFGEDFINITKDLVSHPDFVPGALIFFDFSKINTENISAQDLREISKVVSSNKNKFDNGRWALAFYDNLSFGLARMWQSFTENNVNFQIQIFKDKETAFKWLMESGTEES